MYEVFWTFKLNSVAKKPGYFVQMVEWKQKKTKCDGMEGAPPLNYPYWEAFYVPAGSSYSIHDKGAGFTDRAAEVGLADGCGETSQEGTVKFFYMEGDGKGWGGTGDLRRLWGRCPFAGDLPCTTDPTKVSWWNRNSDQGEGSDKRWSAGNWNCCVCSTACPGPVYSRTNAKPK